MLLLICAMAVLTCAQGWHGIAPLKSTRVDVERILGRPKNTTANTSIYDFRGDEIFVVYSGGPCTTNPEGWDVPQDTVINITLTPKRRFKVTEVNLNNHDYKLKQDEEVGDIAYYVNEDAGISYEVDIREGVVKGITYSPTSKQAPIRCQGAGENILKTVKLGECLGVDLSGDKKLLNDFADFLTRHSSTDAYLIVYEDGSVTDEDAITHRRIIKEYLANDLHLDVRRINIVDGGCRHKPTVELYVVPSGGYPPSATPDRTCDRK
jgi:hypothetical protein